MTDFEARYRAGADPWAVRTAWYERRKRALLMAVLPRERYRHALELGCGEGDTTRLLASRCDAVTAADVSATAIARCRQALAADGAAHARAHVLRVPAAWPVARDARVDLIVVSEIAYYLPGPELHAFIAQCLASLAEEGDWVMCHYKPDFHDRLQSTEDVHGGVHAAARLRRIVAHEDERFRLEVWRKGGPYG